jgi:predicted NBD/HSP70 family sugar kinase
LERYGGLVNLANMFDPDRIVLTGFLARFMDLDGDRLLSSMAASVVTRITRPELVAGVIERPVLIGAAEQAFAGLFGNPRLPQVANWA